MRKLKLFSISIFLLLYSCSDDSSDLTDNTLEIFSDSISVTSDNSKQGTDQFDESYVNQNDKSENIFSDKTTSIIYGVLISNTTKTPVTGFYKGLWARGTSLKLKGAPDYCEGNYIDGKKDGLWRLYIKGKLHGEGQYQDGRAQGTWKYYWPNGQIRLEGKLIDNKRDGLWVGYGEDGIIKYEGNYVYGQQTGFHKDWFDAFTFTGYYYYGKYIDGKRDGLFKGYLENGQLERELLYDNGAVLSITCYNESGAVIPCEN